MHSQATVLRGQNTPSRSHGHACDMMYTSRTMHIMYWKRHSVLRVHVSSCSCADTCKGVSHKDWRTSVETDEVFMGTLVTLLASGLPFPSLIGKAGKGLVSIPRTRNASPKALKFQFLRRHPFSHSRNESVRHIPISIPHYSFCIK